MKNIIVYTLPTCPKCRVLKQKLAAKNLEFTEVQDVQTMQRLDIMSCPAVDIDGELIRDFAAINARINSL